jgi:hypothetical protein
MLTTWPPSVKGEPVAAGKHCYAAAGHCRTIKMRPAITCSDQLLAAEAYPAHATRAPDKELARAAAANVVAEEAVQNRRVAGGEAPADLHAGHPRVERAGGLGVGEDRLLVERPLLLLVRERSQSSNSLIIIACSRAGDSCPLLLRREGWRIASGDAER